MKRIMWTLIGIIVFATICDAQNTAYFPQVADGQAGGVAWKTIFIVTNPAAVGTKTATGTITFTLDNGGAFNIPFTDISKQPVGSGNTIPFQVSGGETRFYFTPGVGTLSTGFATVMSDTPVTTEGIFQEFTLDGNTIASAGVSPAAPLTRQAIVFYEDKTSDTGIAIANPNTGTAAISFQLLDADGAAVLPPSNITLAGNNHTAKFVSQLFPASAGLYGTMQITSQIPLVIAPLYFDSNGTFFTGPVAPLASLINPTLEWLAQRPWLSPIGSLAKLLGSLRLRIG